MSDMPSDLTAPNTMLGHYGFDETSGAQQGTFQFMSGSTSPATRCNLLGFNVTFIINLQNATNNFIDARIEEEDALFTEFVLYAWRFNCRVSGISAGNQGGSGFSSIGQFIGFKGNALGFVWQGVNGVLAGSSFHGDCSLSSQIPHMQ